jgi:predicted DNA-binding protein (MmcQ/YjbR family)
VSYAAIEKHCLGLPAVTRHMPWDNRSPVFKVGGKMFAMIPMGTGRPTGVWFKAGEASFQILTRVDGIEPCPYLARAYWVATDGLSPLTLKELRAYLTRAHGLVAAGLSKKKRESLGIASVTSMEDNPFL